MFISHKSNVIQSIHEVKWQCRRLVKGLDKPEYWAWEETIKDSDGVAVTQVKQGIQSLNA